MYIQIHTCVHTYVYVNVPYTYVYDDVTYVYDDVTYVYDDVTHVYDDVTYVYVFVPYTNIHVCMQVCTCMYPTLIKDRTAPVGGGGVSIFRILNLIWYY